MKPSGNGPAPKPSFLPSLAAVIIGSLFLRAAAGAMGENIQFYFNAIRAAALSPNHPLRAIAGAHHVYPISYTVGGIIIGTFFIAELVGSLVFGAWSDRFGRKWFIILGPFFGAVAVLMTSFTTAVWLLILTRLLEGLSTASNVPATLGYIAEATSQSPRLRTRIAGFFEIAMIGGMAIGLSLGGWLWGEFGTAAIVAGIPLTSPAFAANAVIYLISLVIFWLGLRRLIMPRSRTDLPAISPAQTLNRYWAILSSPRVAGFAPAWIAINAVLGIWLNLSARILTANGHLAHQILVGQFSSLQAGNIGAGFALSFVLGILLWSVLFPGIKKTTAMLIGTGGLILSCGLIFALNHQPTLHAPFVIPLAILLVVTIMIQSGFTPAALAYLADITETRTADRGAIMGLYSVFLGLGQFLGAILGGIFVDWRGADGMALAAGLLAILAALLVLRLRADAGHDSEGTRSSPATRSPVPSGSHGSD
ncbi:MAG: MFS transporter [Anaerolineales bacterium]|jgi:MFS family permease